MSCGGSSTPETPFVGDKGGMLGVGELGEFRTGGSNAGLVHVHGVRVVWGFLREFGGVSRKVLFLLLPLAELLIEDTGSLLPGLVTQGEVASEDRVNKGAIKGTLVEIEDSCIIRITGERD
jgi:hypothetical protein